MFPLRLGLDNLVSECLSQFVSARLFFEFRRTWLKSSMPSHLIKMKLQSFLTGLGFPDRLDTSGKGLRPK